MQGWNTQAIPDLTGRVAIVTGANIGLGYETTLALAQKNAHIVMACRSESKAIAARDQILAQVPQASLELIPLDLSSLASVQQFAATFDANHDQLDLLFNNAGVMAPPRQETQDGFELQFGVNHLGHFALTGLLVSKMVGLAHSRVVTTSSSAQYFGKINFDDLQSQKSYSRYGAYGQSKLANVLFAFELQRRLVAAQAKTLSLPIHPGLVDTNLQTTTLQVNDSWIEKLGYSILMPLLAQTPAQGALPQLYAAIAPDVQGGQHYSPGGWLQNGPPATTQAASAAYNQADAARLWEISESLTGVRYELQPPSGVAQPN